MRRLTMFGAVSGLTLALLMAGAAPAHATLDLQKKAKAAGMPAQACIYCHTDKLPKKDAHSLNERGEWLKSEKEKRQAKEIDPAWLKEYVEAVKK